jgi:hypothetical protein
MELAKAIPLPKEEIQDSDGNAKPDTSGDVFTLQEQSNRTQPDIEGCTAYGEG